MIDLLQERIDHGAEKPAFFDAMKADLEPAIDEARAQWKGASVAITTMSELQKDVREAAAEFAAELVAFRRTIAAHLGRAHPDYQRLRTSRVRAGDDDEVEDVEPSPSPEGKGTTQAAK